MTAVLHLVAALSQVMLTRERISKPVHAAAAGIL
jgi:hypothetical protein